MLLSFLQVGLFVGKISIFIGLLVSLLILIDFNKLPQFFRLLALFYIGSASIDLINHSLAIAGLNNLLFVHLFTFIEFCTMTLFFREVSKMHHSGLNFNLLLWPGLVFVILNTLFIQGLDIFSSYSASMVAAMVIVLSVRFLYHTMDSEQDSQLSLAKKVIPLLLVYYSISLVVLTFSNEMLSISREWQGAVWFIRGMVLLVFRLMIGIYYWQYFKQSNLLAGT
jgi:hypothetical protein